MPSDPPPVRTTRWYSIVTINESAFDQAGTTHITSRTLMDSVRGQIGLAQDLALEIHVKKLLFWVKKSDDVFAQVPMQVQFNNILAVQTSTIEAQPCLSLEDDASKMQFARLGAITQSTQTIAVGSVQLGTVTVAGACTVLMHAHLRWRPKVISGPSAFLERYSKTSAPSPGVVPRHHSGEVDA